MPDYTQIANPDTVAVDLFNLVGGQVFTNVALTIKQFLVLMAACNVTTAASRILYSMGRDGVLPNKFFGYLNPRFSTPTKIIYVVVGLCVVGALFFPWTVLAEVVSFGGMFGFACVNLSVISYFWIKQKDRTKVFGHLILPLFGIISVVYVIFHSSIQCRVLGAIWTALGLIYLFVAYKKSAKFKEAIDRGSVI